MAVLYATCASSPVCKSTYGLCRRIPGIVLSKGGPNWIYTYLFAKKDRSNIEDGELVDFRRLAKVYGVLTQKQLSRLLDDDDLMEICHGNEAQI